MALNAISFLVVNGLGGVPQNFVFTASKISNGACWETYSISLTILLELMAGAATIRLRL